MEGSGRTRTARSSGYIEVKDMDDKEKATIPYFVHEGEMARMDRNNKRLLTALVVSVIALLINNISWLVYTKD